MENLLSQEQTSRGHMAMTGEGVMECLPKPKLGQTSELLPTTQAPNGSKNY